MDNIDLYAETNYISQTYSGKTESLRGIDMLKIDIQSAPPMVKLLCSGRLVLGVEAETLRCMATSRPERRVVVDLQEVHAMDAAGLGLLVELHCRAQRRAGMLTVANPSPCVRRLMALTHLESVLQVAGSAGIGMADDDESERCAMTA
jgi:anti-anti-sigma factor